MSDATKRIAKTPDFSVERYALRWGERETPIPAGGLLIGRASECGLRLEGGLVSRRHARLLPSREGATIEDLGSRNGVLVNQRRISASTVVHHGDEITIGIETLTLVDQLVLSRPAHLSTLPPGSGQFSVSDVDGPVPETRAATLEILTERERQVLSLVVRGHTQREIGQQLHVSAKTVETHRSRIADKLGCRTRAELVAYAITAGLLREE